MPGTNDSLVASAAADRVRIFYNNFIFINLIILLFKKDIYVYDINKDININEIHSHQNRVKRLATAQNEPFLFWSCGEDGLVL